MSPLATFIAEQVASGVPRIGQIEIISEDGRPPYRLCHAGDREPALAEDGGNLTIYQGPKDAREISTWAEDGEYRFSKASENLRRGWLMLLTDAEQLRAALDGFYPAALGLWRAELQGELPAQNLREKLDRQTGMYRYARNISDQGAQRLVREVCGPAHQCAKRILWRIDAQSPLEDSAASRFRGVADGVAEERAIPLLCREACNHFVAECRKVSKQEAEEARTPTPDSH